MPSRWPTDRLDPACYVGPGVDLQVFYSDLDTNKHMNNVAIGRFFEQIRYLTHTAPPIRNALHERNAGMLVARVAIDYLSEGNIGPLMHVRMRVAELGRTSIREEFAAWQDGTCVALAEAVLAYRENGASAAWPAKLKALFTELIVAPPGEAVPGNAVG
jgi:acyl-CoA thioester hydrolase